MDPINQHEQKEKKVHGQAAYHWHLPDGEAFLLQICTLEKTPTLSDWYSQRLQISYIFTFKTLVCKWSVFTAADIDAV